MFEARLNPENLQLLSLFRRATVGDDAKAVRTERSKTRQDVAKKPPRGVIRVHVDGEQRVRCLRRQAGVNRLPDPLSAHVLVSEFSAQIARIFLSMNCPPSSGKV